MEPQKGTEEGVHSGRWEMCVLYQLLIPGKHITSSCLSSQEEPGGNQTPENGRWELLTPRRTLFLCSNSSLRLDVELWES